MPTGFNRGKNLAAVLFEKAKLFEWHFSVRSLYELLQFPHNAPGMLSPLKHFLTLSLFASLAAGAPMQTFPDHNAIVPNLAPLASTPFIHLPLGAVKPQG